MEAVLSPTWNPEPQPERIAKLARDIDFSDSLLPVCYGAGPMNEASRISDAMAGNFLAEEHRASGPCRECLDRLAAMPTLRPSPFRRLLAGVPGLGKLFDVPEEDAARIQTALTGMDALQAQIDSILFELFRDDELLDQLRCSCEKACTEISECIEAGELRCADMNGELSELFQKRLQDMRAARLSAHQTALHLRLLQRNGQELIARMQAGVYALIPAWKAAAAAALTAARQRSRSRRSGEIAAAAGEALDAAKDKYLSAKLSKDLDYMENTREELLRKISEALTVVEVADGVH